MLISTKKQTYNKTCQTQHQKEFMIKKHKLSNVVYFVKHQRGGLADEVNHLSFCLANSSFFHKKKALFYWGPVNKSF